MDFELLIYFEKYLLEELDQEERRQFEKRLKTDQRFASAYSQYLQQLQGPSPNVHQEYDTPQAWERIAKQVSSPQTEPYSPRRNQYFLRNAAVLLALAVLGSLVFWMLQSIGNQAPELVVKTTSYGQKSTITLSDGTTVRLNSGSKFTYPKVFGDSNRIVELEGEAFFDVSPDTSRPFLIRTGKVTTRVLGTSFNIHAFPEEFRQEISVKSGTVQVYISGGQSLPITLKPGKSATYNGQTQRWKVETIAPADIAYWARGYLYFDNEPLSEVFKELGRWYGVAIEVENPEVLNCRITLKQRDENLKNILNIIKFATHVNYQFRSNKVIISGSSC